MNSPTPVYVGFWLRFLAFLVDSVVVLPIVVAIIIGLYQHSGNWLSMLMAGAENFWVNYGIPAAFTLLFWLIKSATPGKMVASAIIVDADTLQKPEPWQLIVRYLGYYISAIFLCLGFVWIALDSRKQGWHDKLARTVVIRRGPSTANTP
ncbi:RDD family protein [Gilvimarinus algae]|uniref:RDD family protein n=1 Tax=Gilvimarinus algae TaxID=3058037 RepID=A0ABT8TAC3_9GAMM|nr:RDD family protein [Gilvimarinus sp. SDUM040014]MDO3380850.1 RDD family protein [Gilvimarinus sp. SDUM040014]